MIDYKQIIKLLQESQECEYIQLYTEYDSFIFNINEVKLKKEFLTVKNMDTSDLYHFIPYSSMKGLDYISANGDDIL